MEVPMVIPMVTAWSCIPVTTGPVVTIRMKNMRDGLEDYEYLWLLREQIKRVKAGELKAPDHWLEKAKAAIGRSTSLVESMKEFTRKGADILEARRGTRYGN